MLILLLAAKVLLLIRRMVADWDKVPSGMRKPWNARDVQNLHAVTGGFLHFTNLLKQKIPTSEYDKSIGEIEEQFMSGFLDVDIAHVLETVPPPGQLEDVGFLRRGS